MGCDALAGLDGRGVKQLREQAWSRKRSVPCGMAASPARVLQPNVS